MACKLTQCFHLNWISKLSAMIARFMEVVIAVVVCSFAFLPSCWLWGCFLKALAGSVSGVLQWALCTLECAGNGYLVNKDNLFHNFQYVNQFGFVWQFSYIGHFHNVFRVSCSISHLRLFWLPDKTVSEVELQNDFSRLLMAFEYLL